MTSRSGALIAAPSWGRAPHPDPAGPPRRLEVAPAWPSVRWGIHAPVLSDLTGAAIVVAAAGLWTAFLLAVW